MIVLLDYLQPDIDPAEFELLREEKESGESEDEESSPGQTEQTAPPDLRAGETEEVDESEDGDGERAEIGGDGVREDDGAEAEGEDEEAARGAFAGEQEMRAEQSERSESESEGVGEESAMERDEREGGQQDVSGRDDEAAPGIEELAGEEESGKLGEEQGEEREKFERGEDVEAEKPDRQTAEQIEERRIEGEKSVAAPAVEETGPARSGIAFGEAPGERSREMVMQGQVALNAECGMRETAEAEQKAQRQPQTAEPERVFGRLFGPRGFES
jgi:hypothetical protein